MMAEAALPFDSVKILELHFCRKEVFP